MEDSEGKWALNRPVSAHITVHYEGENKETLESLESGKVVKTVLNIDADAPIGGENSRFGSRSSMGSLNRYSLREAAIDQVAETGVSPAGSRRASNANSLSVYDFYQCVHRTDGAGSPSDDHTVARRFSEPRLPNNHHAHHHFQMHRHQHRGSSASSDAARSPILRSMSCAADMDPTLIQLPPLSKPRSPGDGEAESPLSPCSSSSSVADSHCLDLSCPCTRHHHRRNSVAVKFNKALYKRA